MRGNTIDDCRIVDIETHSNGRDGNLSVMSGGEESLFPLRRVYYLYDVPGGESRGGHAHRELHEMLVAVSGSFTVTIGDGKSRRTVMLNRPNRGLHIVPGIWRTLDEFSSGAVCLVISSLPYDEADYIREYSDYLEYKKG
ncbi:MAG: FdtA/QdtA family cupin domain-containing protein [Muribaculum sp.]|nr:FdtA/QdtA family cupin domain-containing protein [Muribaculum sp.]